MERHRRFLNVWNLVALCLVQLGLGVWPTRAQTTINANWTDSTGNWTTASNWSCNCVPNNSAANVFNVAIPNTGNADVSLDNTSNPSSITINTLSFVAANLSIEDGASLRVTGDLTTTGPYGSFLYLDSSGAGEGAGGSTLHVAGNMTSVNTANNFDFIGSPNMTSASVMTVGGAFTTTGEVVLNGGSVAGAQALLSVGRATPTTVTGFFLLSGNTGGAAVEYGNGGITQIGDASVQYTNLSLDGPNAYMELSSAPGNNSALTGLKTINTNGSLALLDGASMSTAGALTNDGGLVLQIQSTLRVGGNMANVGYVQLGYGLGGETLSTSGNLTNSGTMNVVSALNVGANVTNTGHMMLGNPSGNEPAVVNVRGAYAQNGGSTDVDGTLIAAGGVTVGGGRLFGGRTVNANVVNDGTVLPGDPAQLGCAFCGFDTLTINGNYTQKADGTLLIEMTPGGSVPVLDVTGKASLDGTLDFEFGYVPGANMDFAFLTAGNVTGDFTEVEITGINCPTCTFNLSTLSVDTGSTAPTAPEPDTLVLLATGLLTLAWLVRGKPRSVISVSRLLRR